MKCTRRGFTIIEVLVVFGILATLLSIGYVSFVGIERRAPLSGSTDTLIGDMRDQQTKAMTGDTQTGVISDDYGVHFLSNAYVLYKGVNYNSADSTNAVTPLPANVTASTTLPGASVVFTKGSGDVVGYADGANTVTLTQNLSGEKKTITINLYGTVTSIQ